MAKELTYKDLCEILSAKCYVSELTVERLLENFVLLIASELQNNSYIKIKNIGKFSTQLKGGCDEWVDDGFGKLTKKYVQPFNYIEFEPSNALVDIVNGDSINYIFHKSKLKYEAPTPFEDVVENNVVTDEVADSINEMLGKRKEKNKKRKERTIKSYKDDYALKEFNEDKRIIVLCKNNNIIYPSIFKCAIDLGIPEASLRWHLLNKKDMKYKGYEFEILTREEEEKWRNANLQTQE
jgi:nucleoid DNA-binding protein